MDVPLAEQTFMGKITAHHPYASANWIRFEGSPGRSVQRRQPLSPLPGIP